MGKKKHEGEAVFYFTQVYGLKEWCLVLLAFKSMFFFSLLFSSSWVYVIVCLSSCFCLFIRVLMMCVKLLLLPSCLRCESVFRKCVELVTVRDKALDSYR